MLNKLFEHLAERFSSENDLSDLTWAVAMASPEFLGILMELFHFADFKPNEPADIEREVQNGDSRPDFLISQNGRQYIIENKICDRQHHFAQYNEAFLQAAKAFISGYRLTPDESSLAAGYQCVTWKNFVELLKAKIKAGSFADEVGVINGYIKFVEEACNIVELEPVRNADGIRGLNAFLRIASWALTEGFQKEGCRCELYSTARAFGDSWAGHYAKLAYSSQKNDILYPFLGIEFLIDKPKPRIIATLDKDWNRVYDKFVRPDCSQKLFNCQEMKSSGYWEFSLKDEKLDAFFDSSLDQQKEIVSLFFSNVIDEILRFA